MADIFISYKSEERALPDALADDLRAAGYTVWWDMELVGGPGFRKQIIDKLEASRAVIVIWTPRSVESDFVLDEADRAKRKNKLIPVRVPELTTDDIPPGHGQAQTYLLAERPRILGALAAMGVLPQIGRGVAPVIGGNGADRRLWEEMRAENSAAAYGYYLRKFPQGAYAAEADDLIWAGLEREASAAAYRQYLDAAPQGRHSAVAEYRLERLLAAERAEAERRQQEKEEAERRRQHEEAERKRKADAEQVAKWKAEGRIPVAAGLAGGPQTTWWVKPGSGESFRDADAAWAPEMVVVPPGKFLMGSTPEEIAKLTKEYGDYFKYEGPQHEVTIPAPFAVGKYAVTFDEWDAAVADGGVSHTPGDAGWGRGRRPVINVSWEDAQAYVKWLSAKTGKSYRLLSESEWEYAARAGTSTPFWWGSSISTAQANYDGNYTYCGGAKGEYREKTVPVDEFKPNPWGLYQVHGNVWEWVEDCRNASYEAKGTALRSSGGAWTTGDCASRALRGGSWFNYPRNLRAAPRLRGDADDRYFYFGFRVARTF